MTKKSQTEVNTQAIREIKTDIKIIKNNHLAHIEKDMEKQSNKIEKMDARLWWVLGLLVASTALGAAGGIL
tara:strand:- start:1877 stop:2089 length:213 start_codon:yes stop_codon:yes gene_type:complete